MASAVIFGPETSQADVDQILSGLSRSILEAVRGGHEASMDQSYDVEPVTSLDGQPDSVIRGASITFRLGRPAAEDRRRVG